LWAEATTSSEPMVLDRCDARDGTKGQLDDGLHVGFGSAGKEPALAAF
jgi:hypothetical protein